VVSGASPVCGRRREAGDGGEKVEEAAKAASYSAPTMRAAAVDTGRRPQAAPCRSRENSSAMRFMCGISSSSRASLSLPAGPETLMAARTLVLSY